MSDLENVWGMTREEIAKFRKAHMITDNDQPSGFEDLFSPKSVTQEPVDDGNQSS